MGGGLSRIPGKISVICTSRSSIGSLDRNLREAKLFLYTLSLSVVGYPQNLLFWLRALVIVSPSAFCGPVEQMDATPGAIRRSMPKGPCAGRRSGDVDRERRRFAERLRLRLRLPRRRSLRFLSDLLDFFSRLPPRLLSPRRSLSLSFSLFLSLSLLLFLSLSRLILRSLLSFESFSLGSLSLERGIFASVDARTCVAAVPAKGSAAAALTS